MPKRIALVGLNHFNNMGDQLIAVTTKYIIQSMYGSEIEPYFVDVSPYDSYCRRHLAFRFKLFRLIHRIQPQVVSGTIFGKLRYYIQSASWWVKLYHYYKKELKSADAIIFSGGGFIKYDTQELNYLVDMITRIASQLGIPVMFNAMGVEGYHAKDTRCQKLKQAINRPCVKQITVRDDLTLLREKYITNQNIRTLLVGDSALYAPDLYTTSRKKSRIVGIGVIRSDIFLKYGINYSEGQVMQFYQGLIHELEDKGIAWRLFSNGLTSDHEFGLQLLDELGLDHHYYIGRPKTPLELVNVISRFDAIIASRLHACITAYSLGIHATGLVWNNKLRLFARLIGREASFHSAAELDPKQVVHHFQQKRYQPYNEKQRKRLKALTRESLAAFINTI